MKKEENKNDILLIDFETTAQIGFYYGRKWETNIIETIEHTKVLSFSAKWLGGKHITKGWCDYKGYKGGVKDDTKIVLEIWNLMDKASIIIAHNGRAFDFKVINARFAQLGLPPPSPYKTIDTLIEARKYFKLPSYSLDDLSEFFGFGHKLKHTGFALWKDCVRGKKAAWSMMKAYNKHDVVLLEKVYLKIRPYLSYHPFCQRFEGKCPKCGSKELHARGYALRATGIKYQRYRCCNCGGWAQDSNGERYMEQKSPINAR